MEDVFNEMLKARKEEMYVQNICFAVLSLVVMLLVSCVVVLLP